MKQGRFAEFPVRGLIVSAAIVMMAVGLSNGEAKTVLAKAIEICLECIGIG